MNEINIPIKKLHSQVQLPAYAHENDAGMDIYAAKDVWIRPGETKAVPTGFSIAIPNGFEAQIRPRSGLSLKTMLRLPNSPGTIDAGYRDEVCVILHNASFPMPDNKAELLLDEQENRHGTYHIRRGDRIAQMVFAVVSKVRLNEVDSIKNIGKDRRGGLGSTGVQ